MGAEVCGEMTKDRFQSHVEEHFGVSLYNFIGLLGEAKHKMN